jgi:hypothetical protein
MTQRRLWALLAGLGLALGLWARAEAADPAVMEAAKKEGKVVWYSSLGLSVAQKVCDAFNKKALGITCELNRDGSQRIFQKVMQEAGANLAIADVVHTSDISHYLEFQQKNMLMRYLPAGADKFPADFRDKDGLYTVLRGTPYVIGYNTQKVAAAERPSLEGPRRRAWKGKLVHAHPGYSGVVMTGILGLLPVWVAGTTTRRSRRTTRWSCSRRGPADEAGRRRAWVGATGEYNLYREVKKGNPIAIVFPAGGPALRDLGQRDPGQGAAPERGQGLHGLPLRQGSPADPRRRRLYVPNAAVTYPKDKRPLKELKLCKVEPEEMQNEGRRGEEEVPRAVRGLSRMPARRGTARRRERPRTRLPPVWSVSAAILAVLVVAPARDPPVHGVPGPRGPASPWPTSSRRSARRCTGPRSRTPRLCDIGRAPERPVGARSPGSCTRTGHAGEGGLSARSRFAAFVTPSFLGATAYVILAGPNAGLLNVLYRAVTGADEPLFNIFSMTGLIYVTSLYTFPVVFILTSAALTRHPPTSRTPARIAGAGRLAVMRTITLPSRSRRSSEASSWPFLEALVLFGAPAMLAIPRRFHVMTTQVWAFFHYPPQVEVAAAPTRCRSSWWRWRCSGPSAA